MRYADPHLCPDCRSDVSDQPAACPTCDLPLRHPLAGQVFSTLLQADALLAALRATATAPDPAPLPRYPAPARSGTPVRSGLRVSSVPGLLLSLGALCLLVAAVTFLTLAWSSLGIGGRTAILLALTAPGAALAVHLHRRGLRVAAEALATVSLGLVVLDTLGAIDAGWFGTLDTPGALVLTGLALAVSGLGLLAVAPRLLSAEAGAAVGAGLVVLGLDGWVGHGVGHDAAYTAAAAVTLALLARATAGTRALAPLLAVQAALWWLGLVATGIARATTDPTLDGLWRDGQGYAAAAAVALMLLPGLLTRRRLTLLASATAAATAGTALLALPVADEGTGALGVAALAALAAWTVAALALPRGWQPVAAGPTLLAVPVALGVVVDVLAVVAGRLALAPWSLPADARLSVDDPVTSPLLLLPLVLALLAAATVWSPAPIPLPVTATTLGLAGAATLASYDVRLALVLAVVAAAALATRSPVLAVAAVAVALPSAALAAAACAVATAVGWQLRRTAVGDVLLPAALALGVTSAAEAVGLDPALRGYPVLLALGALALLRTRPVLEATAAGCAALAAAAAIDDTTSLAVHLTLAGALVVGSALAHPHRRLLAAPGGLLLATATWVRLADLGVTAPEPYTLPLALCLVAGAIARLVVDDEADTRLLLPGLALATVPSLLWVLVDPVHPRAVLLGGACLALVLAGTRLRWSAPLLVGGAVGTLVVLRELAPYAQATPQWVLIGLAGTVLTAVGVTWERRLLELRRVAASLERMR